MARYGTKASTLSLGGDGRGCVKVSVGGVGVRWTWMGGVGRESSNVIG